MAWLEADAKPIVAGWGPEPQLSAPNIGELVKGVLANRLGQQKLTQDSLSEAIKNMQAQRQASAFGSALQNAGVVPQGVDLSNMSGPDLSKLADLYQGTIADTDEDKAKQALANFHNAAAQSLWTYPGGKGTAGVDYSQHAIGDIYRDEATGLMLRMTRTGPVPLNPALQPSTTRSQNMNQLQSEQDKLGAQQTQLDTLRALQQQSDMKANKPNNPFAQEDLYQRNLKRQQEIQRQMTMPHADQTGDTTDQTDTQNQNNQINTQSTSQLGPDAQKRILAQQALNDPQATDAEKAQARIILGQ